MEPNDVNSFLLEGTQSGPSPNAGFTRLTSKGLLSNFVEFRSIDTADPALGPFPPGSHATYLVKNTSELHFSDYVVPPPAAAPVFPTGPVKRGAPAPAPAGEYLASDGTILKPTITNGQITGFSGKSKAGDTYALSVQTGTSRGPKNLTNDQTWVGARISITKTEDNKIAKNGADPLMFGFSYSPLYMFFSVFLEQANISTGINLDYHALVSNGQGGSEGSASAARGLTYYGDSYSLQTLPVDADQNDPKIYLPARLTMWPFLERAAFFAPALKTIAAETGGTLPVSAHPLASLGSLPVVWPAAIDKYVMQTLEVVGPALGPLAASFVPPPDSGIAGMDDAARWLGWILMRGSGSLDLVAALEGQYNYWKNQVPATGGGRGALPIWEAPSARLTIGAQVQDWLFEHPRG
jgi:hypothetical protein